MKYAIVLVLLVLIAGLTSCVAALPPTPTVALSPLADSTSGSGVSPLAPATAAPATSGELQVAMSGTAEPAASSPDKGTVTGQLVDQLTGKPLADLLLYLGGIMPLKVGEVENHSIIVMLKSSPSTASDAEGRFRFTNVPPGVYALVLWSPHNSTIVSDPKTKLDILITVEANKTADMGRLPAVSPN